MGQVHRTPTVQQMQTRVVAHVEQPNPALLKPRVHGETGDMPPQVLPAAVQRDHQGDLRLRSWTAHPLAALHQRRPAGDIPEGFAELQQRRAKPSI